MGRKRFVNMKRGRKGILTLIREVDSIKVCRNGSEKVFILPRAMTGEDYGKFKQDNRRYFKKIKTKKS